MARDPRASTRTACRARIVRDGSGAARRPEARPLRGAMRISRDTSSEDEPGPEVSRACRHCGHARAAESRRCPHCGSFQGWIASTHDPRALLLVAVFVACVLGAIGFGM